MTHANLGPDDNPNVRDYGPTDERLEMYHGFKYDDLTRLARARWKRIRELEGALATIHDSLCSPDGREIEYARKLCAVMLASHPAPEPVALRAENGVPTLDELVEWARRQPPPTEAQKREQAISFAYGNLKLSGWQGTREDIEKAADELWKVSAPEPVKLPEGIVLPCVVYEEPLGIVIRGCDRVIVAQCSTREEADWICALLNAAGGGK